MKTIVVDTEVNTKDAQTEIGKLSKTIEKLSEAIEQTNEEQKELNKSIEDSSKASAKSVGRLEKGFKGVGLAIKAAGIGLLLKGLTLLQDVFMSNQKVADFFAKTMEFITIAFNDLVNFLLDNTGPVIDTFKSIFENPVESIKSLGEAIKNNIIERFQSMLDTVGFAGEAIKKFITGDFEGAKEAALNAGKELVDVYTGVDGTVDKIGETASKVAESVKEYATATWDAADAAVELSNNSRLAEAQQQGIIEKYDRLAELQRQIRDNDQLSFEERIAANEKLGMLLTQQGEEERKLVLIRLAAADAQLQKDRENVDALVARQNALNELAAVEARIEGFRSEQLINRNALEREQEQLRKDADDEAKREQEASDKKQADTLKQIEEDKQKGLAAAQQKGFQIAQQLAGENQQAQQSIAAVQATVDTYTAIAGQLKAFAGVPVPGYAIAQAVATGLFGFLQVKNILNTKAPQTSSSVTSGTGTPNISADIPTDIAPEITSFNEGVGLQQNSRFANVKAVVIQQDVTNAQSLAQVIQDQERV